MSLTLEVRAARAEDAQPWRALWRGYFAALGGAISDEVTEAVWQHILAQHEIIGCLLAFRGTADPIGFANYVLHPRTWSLQSVCYLEDIFVMPEARGSGAGSRLIEELVRLGKQKGWRRVYWHTHEALAKLPGGVRNLWRFGGKHSAGGYARSPDVVC